MFDLLLILCIGTLYLGFAAVLGVLVRQAQRQADRRWAGLALAHGLLLVLPASALVLGQDRYPPVFGLVVVTLGVLAAWAGAVRPIWLPSTLWQIDFGARYFAIAMVLTAGWGLALSLQRPSLGAALVGATALTAALTSLAKTTHSAKAVR